MKNSKLLYLGILSQVLMLQACLNDVESDVEKRVRLDDDAIHTYLTENNIEAEKSSFGVYMVPLKENTPGKQVQENHVAGILYTIKPLNGQTVIEAYSDTLHPLQFNHSSNALLPAGLNYAVGQMRVGEKYRFFIPSYLAFGAYGHQGLFESYSNFIMEVDLVSLQTEEEVYESEVDSIQAYMQLQDIEAEAYPNGLYYKNLEQGTGPAPTDNSRVKFHFTRKYLDGTVIETTKGKNPIEVYFQEKKLVKGLEQGLRLMKEGEKALLIMPSKIAFGKSVQVIPQKVRESWVKEEKIDMDVLPYTPVIYEVELLDVN